MAVYRYSEEVHEFVKENCTKLRDQELAIACNEALGTEFTTQKMKAFRTNHGYKNHMKQYSREEYWKYQTKYPKGMYEFIRDKSWGVSSKEMAEMVNEKFGTDLTPTRMKQFRQKQGIKSGLTGWYQKGHAPGNKGKKLEEYITDPERLADIRRRIAPTQFKKGQKAINELPVGSVRVVDGYKLIKVQAKGTQWERWKFLHREVWIEHNGEIPEGYIVSFKDSNPLNCDIDNLMLITKRENAILNQKKLRFEDPDLTETALNMTRLQNAADDIRKERKNEQS